MENLKIKIQKLFRTEGKAGRRIFIATTYVLYWLLFFAAPLFFVTQFSVWEIIISLPLMIGTSVLKFMLFQREVFDIVMGVLSEYGNYLSGHPQLEAFGYFFILAPLFIILPSFFIYKVLPGFQRKIIYLFVFGSIFIVFLVLYAYVLLVGAAFERGFSF